MLDSCEHHHIWHQNKPAEPDLKDSPAIIRQSDVTAWGIAALACGALAILSANLGAMLPANLMAGLHATKIEGGSLNQLRAEVETLREETGRIRQENNRLMGTVTLAEQENGLLMRRVGAIEASLPALFETGPRGASIDASLTTAGIDEEETETIVTENGTVVVSRRPMIGTSVSEIQIQERPEALEQDAVVAIGEPLKDLTGPASAFGLALGSKVKLSESVVTWKEIIRNAGPLLLGLEPVLSGTAGAEEMQLVAGPISGYAQAEQICTRMVRIGVSCLPVPYMGNALPE